MANEKAHVFLSYASPDREKVRPFFHDLEREGFSVWMDCEKLLPGQDWNFEIGKAFDNASVVLLFLSRVAVGRRGYVQREWKWALRKLEEKVHGDIYLIPVCLDDLAIPDQLEHLQAISVNAPDALARISEAIRLQLQRVGEVSVSAQEREGVYWTYEEKAESWEGLPGYYAKAQSVALRSDRYPNVFEVSDVIRGAIWADMMETRRVKLEQQPEWFNFAQEEYSRTNTFEVQCEEPTVSGRMLSVVVRVYEYYAGAAHGQSHFVTYSFLLDPLIQVKKLEEIFSKDGEALVAIRSHVRGALRAVSDKMVEEDGAPLGSLEEGTESWSDYRCFAFSAGGIEVLFDAEVLGAYACGSHRVVVPYDVILEYMKPLFRSALGGYY